MNDTRLSTLKEDISGHFIDSIDDTLLETLIKYAELRLCWLTKTNVTSGSPAALDYILVDVVCARFNRIGSEGTESHNVEGETLTFTDDEFAKFKNDIDAWLASDDTSNAGKVRFI